MQVNETIMPFRISALKFPGIDRFTMSKGTLHMGLKYKKGQLATNDQMKVT